MFKISSETLFVSASLCFLPLLALCFIFFLPFIIFAIVGLYLIAWTTFYVYAQSEDNEKRTRFDLPCNPSKVLRMNMLLIGSILGWIKSIPMILSYLYWRYWELGTERFKSIVSQDIPFTADCKLDVYHPTTLQHNKPNPIIIFVYGGGWGSGSKLLYTTLANTLRELGYVVVVPDYRKCPKVKVDDMYQDIREAIKWTYSNAYEINGDPELIFVMGHSAGAQLTAQVILSDIIKQAEYDSSNITTHEAHVSEKHDPTKEHRHMINHPTNDFLPLVEGILLFSGVYDIASHLNHETSRGVEKLSVMARAMGSCLEGYKKNSPIHLIESNPKLFLESEDLLDLLPRILLLHGQQDETVGIDQSANMFNALGESLPSKRRQEVDVRMRIYKRMGHGEPILSLMHNYFSKKTDRHLLIRDIQEFIECDD